MDEERFEVRDLRQKEKFIIDDFYLNGHAKVCGWQATLVYVSLCRHANKEQECFPSIKLIGEELKISRPTVIKGIKGLKNYNIIKTKKNRTKTGKWVNNTYILVDKKHWKGSQVKHVDLVSQVNENTQPSKRQFKNQVNDVDTKETHIKETHIKVKDITSLESKEVTSSKQPVDNSNHLKQPFPAPTSEQKRELAVLSAKLEDLRFNIFVFISKVKKVKGFYPPIKLMIQTANAVLKKKPENVWGYFTEVLKKELPNYFADLEIQEHQKYKEMPIVPSIKQIMVGIGKEV